MNDPKATSTLRKVLMGLGGFVVLLIVIAAIVPMFVNAERFRPMVESRARAALGRGVKIGKLDFSLLRGAVVAEDVTVDDDPAFSKAPFLQAKSLRIGVEVMPLLLSRDIHVQQITLNEPHISLLHNAAGKWNFESLGATNAETASRENPGQHSDRRTGHQHSRKPAQKEAPAGSRDAQRPSAQQQFSIAKIVIKNGSATVTDEAKKSHEYTNVDMTLSDLSPGSVSPFELSAATPGGGSIHMTGKAGPLNMGNTSATPFDAAVDAKDVNLATTGFVASDSGIGGMVDYKGNVKSDGKKVHSDGAISAGKIKLVRGGQPAQTPVNIDYASDMDLQTHSGTITKGDIHFGQALARLTGNFTSAGEQTLLNARLTGNNLPLNAVEGVLPALGVEMPAGSRLSGGVVNTDLALQGPIDRLVTSGPVNVANAKVEGFNLKSRASALGALAGLPSANDLLIQALNSKLRVAPDGIRADSINLVIPGIGSVTGDGTIAPNNALNFRMKAHLAATNLLGGLSQLTSLGQSKGELPFRIQGTTNNPVFVPDVGAAMSNTISAPIKGTKSVGGILGGLFGKKNPK